MIGIIEHMNEGIDISIDSVININQKTEMSNQGAGQSYPLSSQLFSAYV
jgi:hypothetical protein